MRLQLRPAFALTEIVIAAFVFAVGILALEATAVSALHGMRRSSDIALAAAVARARLERLAASRCSDLRDGADSLRSVISTWTLEPTASFSIRAVRQTVSYTVDGVERVDTYRATFPCTP